MESKNIMHIFNRFFAEIAPWEPATSETQHEDEEYLTYAYRTHILSVADKRSVQNAIEILKEKFSNPELTPGYSMDCYFSNKKTIYTIKVIDCTAAQCSKSLCYETNTIANYTVTNVMSPNEATLVSGCTGISYNTIEIFVNFEYATNDAQLQIEEYLRNEGNCNKVLICVKKDLVADYNKNRCWRYLSNHIHGYIVDEEPSVTITSSSQVIEDLKENAIKENQREISQK